MSAIDKLRRLRDRLVDFCGIRDRGYDGRREFSPLWVLDEIDRLLAEPETPEPVPEPFVEAFVALKRERDRPWGPFTARTDRIEVRHDPELRTAVIDLLMEIARCYSDTAGALDEAVQRVKKELAR